MKSSGKQRIVLAIVIIAAIAILAFLKTPFRTEEYAMDMEIPQGKLIGLNSDTDGFHFGKVPIGWSGQRKLDIMNGGQQAHVVLTKSGELAAWVNMSESDFMLGPYENKTITFRTNVPYDLERKKYEGKIGVSFFRPLNF